MVHAHTDPPETTQAAIYYQDALALAEELCMRPLVAHCYRSMGMLHAKSGQCAQARAELAMAMEMYHAMEMTFWLPQTEAAPAQLDA